MASWHLDLSSLIQLMEELGTFSAGPAPDGAGVSTHSPFLPPCLPSRLMIAGRHGRAANEFRLQHDGEGEFCSEDRILKRREELLAAGKN